MKVFTYIIIMMGIMLLLSMSGIDTASNKIIKSFYNSTSTTNDYEPSDLEKSPIFVGFLLMLAGLGIGAVAIGLITRSFLPESYLLVFYALFIIAFGLDMISIVSYINSNYGGWLSAIVSLILLPIVAGYVHAVISWWGGRD